MGPAGAREIEELRRAAATALERGLAFVEAHGDELAILRTHVMLGARPLEHCVEAVAARQRRDGSFPELGLASAGALGFDAGSGGSPDEAILGTLEALVVLSDLPALFAPCVERAAVFLQAVQLGDGSWGAADAEPAQRIFSSGLLAGILGRTRVVRPEVLDAAGRFLAGQWAPERVEGESWGLLAAFGTFFSNVPHDLSDGALQWVGRELERGYRTRRYDTAATLRVLLHCDAAAVPGATLEPSELLRSLLAEQGRDGGFAELCAAGPARRVAPTVDCMLANIRLCRML